MTLAVEMWAKITFPDEVQAELDKISDEVEIPADSKRKDLRKLFTFYDGRAKFDYWIAPPDLEDEKMPEVDPKTFKRKIRKKDINETIRKEYSNKARYKK